MENELNKLWQSKKTEHIQINTAMLAEELNRRINALEALLKTRNQREYIALGLLVILFIAGILLVSSVLIKMILGGLLCWAMTAAYKIHSVATLPVPSFDSASLGYLKAVRNNLLMERKLIHTAFFWYILPPLVLEIVFLYGQGMKGMMLVAGSIPLFLISGMIYYLNRRSIKKQFDPLIEDISQSIRKLEE